jgi:hypothetical protein
MRSIGTSTLTVSGGALETKGDDTAHDFAAVTLGAACMWWTNTAAVHPGGAGNAYAPAAPAPHNTPYTVSSADRYVSLVCGTFAVVSDITVGGTAGAALTPQTATVTLYGAGRSVALAAANVSPWFAGLPAGVTVTAAAAAGSDVITLTFGGTPSAPHASTFSITLPATALTGTVGAITALPNPAAVFAISAPPPAASITVTGAGGATAITSNGGTLQMSAAVLPATASQTVTWSVTNGTGSATVSAGGLLTAASNGTVTVSATATDGSGVTGTLVITISGQIPPPAYAINIGSFAGGTVTASAHSATAGTAVTLTVTPSPGYELRYIWAHRSGNSGISVPLHGSGSTRSFTMPDFPVTVEAAFEDPVYQAAWNAALALIEKATFTLTQAEAANEAAARYRLAELINALIAPTGFL